jgi:hypothetical protein
MGVAALQAPSPARADPPGASVIRRQAPPGSSTNGQSEATDRVAVAASAGRDEYSSWVLSCAEIRSATSSWAAVEDHAIEQAVSRLRHTLHDGELIQTVMRRGYRLAG